MESSWINLWKLKWDLIDPYIQSLFQNKVFYLFIEIMDNSLYFCIRKLEYGNLESL